MTFPIEAVRWFKTQFGDRIQQGVAGTPFSVDMISAIAIQETGYIWVRVYDKLTVEEMLTICASDIIDDTGGRDEFPKNRRELVAAPRGEEMFAIGRQALIDLSVHCPEFRRYTTSAFPNKFCRGYGVFQYDLQFYEDDPDFFLQKRWSDFDEYLRRLLDELKGFWRRYYRDQSPLTDQQMVYVAIAYNKGSVNIRRSFKQGHVDDGRYYGEYIWEYLQLSKTVHP